MKRFLILYLLAAVAYGMAIQKILRPETTTIMYEKVSQPAMGVTLDVSVIQGEELYIKCGTKNRMSQETKLVNSYKKNLELKEAGEFEVHIINKSGDFANVTISIYVDRAHEDTDDAEVLRKLLDKVRVDLLNIYNDVLKLKNSNMQSLRKAKSTRNILWILSIFPVMYVFLSIVRLRFIKSFFSNKKQDKI